MYNRKLLAVCSFLLEQKLEQKHFLPVAGRLAGIIHMNRWKIREQFHFFILKTQYN